jgi:hypothetical protein
MSRIVTEAQRQARRRWRIRRHEAGLSWACVVTNHDACSGQVGRLEVRHRPRPMCQCSCHTEAPDEGDLT